jgi:hypothetical protein
MTAASDLYNFPVRVRQVRFVGTGLTVGQELRLKEFDTNGAVICDHFVTATTEDFIVWEAGDRLGSWVRKPFVDAIPAGGGGQIIFQLS